MSLSFFILSDVVRSCFAFKHLKHSIRAVATLFRTSYRPSYLVNLADRKIASIVGRVNPHDGRDKFTLEGQSTSCYFNLFNIVTLYSIDLVTPYVFS